MKKFILFLVFLGVSSSVFAEKPKGLIAAACGNGNSKQINIFSPDGGHRKTLTKFKNTFSPNWSPDGKQIVFVGFQENTEIYLVSAKGGKDKQLTRNGSTNITPVFSPDGKTIIYASSLTRDAELYQINVSDGSNSRLLTRTPGIDLSPSFSPDGSKIVFASERSGNLHLFSMSARGGGASRLTYVGLQNDQPDISPDGKWIAFATREREAFNIFTMKRDGSIIRRISNQEGGGESPTWSPDGRFLAFATPEGIVILPMEEGGIKNNITYGSCATSGAALPLTSTRELSATLIPHTKGCVNPDWGSQ